MGDFWSSEKKGIEKERRGSAFEDVSSLTLLEESHCKRA
jgi:hypothetical protein